MKILAKRLREARDKAGYNQIEASKKLGISNGTLSGYERDYRDPDTDILHKMANLYDVKVDWLIGRSDNQNTSKDDTYDSLEQITHLLKKYDINQSGFFDIEKWKAMGPEEIKELESYFEFITSRAKKKNKQQD